MWSAWKRTTVRESVEERSVVAYMEPNGRIEVADKDLPVTE